MLKNLLLGALLAISTGAAAQNNVRVVFSGGLHSATVKPFWNRHPLAFDSLAQTTPRTGAHCGFHATIPLGHRLQLQPGFHFSAKGATQIQVLDTTKTATRRLSDEQAINYVDVPVNLVLALPLGPKTKFLLGGGPQASLFFNGKSSQTAFDTSGKLSLTEASDLPVGKGAGQYRLLHWGVNALAGFEFGRLVLTANYSHGLTPYWTEGGKEATHSTMGASIGFFLGRKPQAQVATPPAPKDKDGDSVPDATDACPDVAGPVLTGGCPDRDGDGIGDGVDACPDQKGPTTYNGCPPPDKDGDGVLDAADSCPEIAGLAKYKGCPVPDSDGDGINDEADSCAQVAGTPQYAGCPPPPVQKEVAEKVAIAARLIGFAHASPQLLPTSLPVLDEVAALMQQHPALKLTVEGHTSTVGAAAINQKLSEQRAQKVKAYLQSRGVAGDRISAVGYGSSRPVSTGKSETDQARNRRVELKLDNE